MVKVFDYQGKHYEFHYHDEPDLVDVIFNEVYCLHQYREGLTHIKKVKNPIVVDLGAYIGISPHYFAQDKDATIYAVEPNPYSFAALKLNCTNRDKIIPFNFGIGYRTKERELVIPDNNSTAMSFYGKGAKVFKVFTYSIDDFFKKYDITHVDLLKIDVEGAEFEIFLSEGFKNVADKIDMIIGEAHDHPINHFNVQELLKQRGFTFRWKPDLNYTISTNYRINDLEGQIKTNISTLFIATKK